MWIEDATAVNVLALEVLIVSLTCQSVVHIKAKTFDLLHGQTSVYKHPVEGRETNNENMAKHLANIYSSCVFTVHVDKS